MSANSKCKNVCQSKGHLRYAESFGRFVPQPCECKQPFVRYFRAVPIKTKYAIVPSLDSASPIRVRVSDGKTKGKGEHLVVPCGEIFKKNHSKGTKLYHRWSGSDGFPGCQAVEEQLLAEGLISHSGFDLLRDSDMPKNEADDDSKIFVDMDRLPEGIKVWEYMVRRTTPRKKQNDLFSRFRGALFFRNFWKKLRREERQSVKHYFLENKENKTMRDVAKRLKISVSTLHERLEKAKVLLREEREKAGAPKVIRRAGKQRA